MMTTTKLLSAFAVAALFGTIGCAGQAPQVAPSQGRSLADVSPELLQQATAGQPTDSYEVEWEDTTPEKVEKDPTAHTRAARSQLFTRSRKNKIFVSTSSSDSPTGFTSAK